MENKLKELEAEVSRLKRINAVLMNRIESSVDSQGSAYSLFESNTALNQLVKDRTLEIEKITSEIQSEKNLLSAIINSLPGMIIIFDSDLWIINSFIGKFNSVRLNNDMPLSKTLGSEFEMKIQVFKQTDKDSTTEFEFSATLSEKNFVLHATCVHFKDSQYLLFLRDVTSYHLQQQTIKSQEALLVQASKLSTLGEISAGIAHEINNPLAIIVANLSTLERAASDPVKLAAKIESLQKSAYRIEKIVTGLRKYARSSQGMTHQLHSLNELINESMVLTELRAKKADVAVTFELQQGLHIECDQVEIEQVIVNLINNAIDAAKHFNEKWVRVSAFNDKKNIVLRVFDSGDGIPQHLHERIFSPFYTTKPVGEGTGLGLPIVKGILNQHHATIEINQQMPNTCFEVRFPIPNT